MVQYPVFLSFTLFTIVFCFFIIIIIASLYFPSHHQLCIVSKNTYLPLLPKPICCEMSLWRRSVHISLYGNVRIIITKRLSVGFSPNIFIPLLPNACISWSCLGCLWHCCRSKYLLAHNIWDTHTLHCRNSHSTPLLLPLGARRVLHRLHSILPRQAWIRTLCYRYHYPRTQFSICNTRPPSRGYLPRFVYRWQPHWVEERLGEPRYGVLDDTDHSDNILQWVDVSWHGHGTKRQR